MAWYCWVSFGYSTRHSTLCHRLLWGHFVVWNSNRRFLNVACRLLDCPFCSCYYKSHPRGLTISFYKEWTWEAVAPVDIQFWFLFRWNCFQGHIVCLVRCWRFALYTCLISSALRIQVHDRICMGVKLGRPHWGRKVGWGCFPDFLPYRIPRGGPY
jgi:hypothetical protein